MMLLISRAGCTRKMLPGGSQKPSQADRRSYVMKWETPTAIDFRFGMEITMYIANR